MKKTSFPPFAVMVILFLWAANSNLANTDENRPQPIYFGQVSGLVVLPLPGGISVTWDFIPDAPIHVYAAGVLNTLETTVYNQDSCAFGCEPGIYKVGVTIGNSCVTATTEVEVCVFPKAHSLFQNYPNPFNPTTTITYDLPATSHVRLTVFNAAGQVITTLVDAEQEAGNYHATWDGSAVPSGVYFYRLEGDGFTKTMKMTLMK